MSKINLVGNREEIKNEIILNDFDVNFLPLDNLPITYFSPNPINLNNLNNLNNNETENTETDNNIDDGLTDIDSNYKQLKIVNDKLFILKKDTDVELLLVGGGGAGGGSNKGAGGGGEVIFYDKYRLKKGIYNISKGIGGTSTNNSGETSIKRDNTILFTAKGGYKANDIIGGASHQNSFGKGANYVSSGGEENYGKGFRDYGKGGKLLTAWDRNVYYGSGGKGNDIGSNRNGIDGVVIIKFKNEDLKYFKKYTSYKPDLKKKDVSIASYPNAIEEPTKDNPNYKLIVYKTTGSLRLTKDIVCDILLVGGGGGGGYDSGGGGGGGGGGGVYEILNYNLKTGTYSINIGAGGAGGVSVSSINNGAGSNGSNTFISSTPSNRLFEAGGGGGGGSGDIVNNAPEITIGIEGIKGSGGGAGILVTNSNNQVKNEEGITNKSIKNGGTGYTNGGRAYLTFNNKDANSWKITNGGGGGAGGNGKDGDLNKNISGDGGVGKKSQITLDYYGGGGRGGEYIGVSKRVGNSAIVPLRIAKIGDVNTGGGGGGGEHTNNGGSGGSGIVIIRVKAEDLIGETTTDFEKQFNHDTTIVNLIKNEFRTKIKIFDDINKPYNYFSIYPLVIITIIIWIFILLFLLKFLHYYFASIYIYILIIIIIFLLIFGSLWFLYTNNDLL